MQEITFSTSSGTITINDCGTSSVNGKQCLLWLNDFDGNSLSQRLDAIECIDIPGQKVLSTTPKPRTIVLKIGFAPIDREQGAAVCRGEAGKHLLRREVLRAFSLGEEGTLFYRNNAGSFQITARLDEIPRISYTAGAWAEATVYLTADYPYWTYPLTKSPEVIVTPSSPGIITSTAFGDIESPVEVIVQCTEGISASGGGLRLKFFVNNVDSYLLGVNCYADIPAGTTIKYDIGTKGELMSYRLAGSRWVNAPEYWTFMGNERRVCNGISATDFNARISSGSASVKIVYHNIALAV